MIITSPTVVVYTKKTSTVVNSVISRQLIFRETGPSSWIPPRSHNSNKHLLQSQNKIRIRLCEHISHLHFDDRKSRRFPYGSVPRKILKLGRKQSFSNFSEMWVKYANYYLHDTGRVGFDSTLLIDWLFQWHLFISESKLYRHSTSYSHLTVKLMMWIEEESLSLTTNQICAIVEA